MQNLRTNRWKTFFNPKEDLWSVILVGLFSLHIAPVVWECKLQLSRNDYIAQMVHSIGKEAAFFRVRVPPALSKSSKTLQRCSMDCSSALPKTTKSLM